MTAWAALLPPALVGTDRFSGAWPPAGAWPDAVTALVAQAAGVDNARHAVDAAGATSASSAINTSAAANAANAAGASHRAQALLRAAAVLAVVQGAADFGRPWASALPAAAVDDPTPAALADPQLAWLLHDGPPRVQHELLAVLAAHGLRLPDAWLPTALDLGRRTLALRAPVAAVLGTRGAWLAAQRDDWQWAAGSSTDDDPGAWTDGSLQQRAAWLQRQRATAPATARDQLAAALPELPANERAELLAVLNTGLSADDEPLLDAALQDRSREVRQAAATLLLRLPDSAFVARATSRMQALLREERVLLRKRWVIEPPAEVPPPDPPRPKHDPLGERAWWLYLAARQVPLAWWCSHLHLDPTALLAWAADTDWADALHRAWRDLLFTAPDPAWCAAFLRQWPRGAGRDDSAAVLALLPLAEREAHWLRQLDRALDRDGALSDDLLAQLALGCPAPQHLSLALSKRLAAAVRARLDQRPLANDWPLRAALPDIAGLLHPQALEPLRTLPPRSDDTPAVAELAHSVQRIAAARTTLHALHTLQPTRTPP